MPISGILHIITPLILFFSFTSSALSDSGVDDSRTTVKIDSLEVHSEMSESSRVLKSLKKGDMVRVAFEMDGSGGTWCGIIEEGRSDVTGYVPCSDLDHEDRQGKAWKMIDSAGMRDAANGSAKGKASPKRAYSDIQVTLYMTSW